MTEVKLNLVALNSLDLVGSVGEALQSCVDNNIPVFISRPEKVTLWAIAHDFAETVLSYKKLKENNFKAEHVNITKPNNYKLFKAIHGRSKLPLLFNEPLQYLRMHATDISSLINSGQAKAGSFIQALRSNEKGRLEWIDYVETFQFMPSILSSSYLSDGYQNQDIIKLQFCSSEFTFNTYHQGRKKLESYDDPLNDEISIEIKVEDCLVFSEDGNQLTRFLVEHIPEESPYFVPENCRRSSKLNQLAVLGHRLYIDKNIPAPKNIAKYLEVELSVKRKEAEAASFFINPKPSGSMKDKYKNKTQFQHLVEVYKKAYIDKELDVKRQSSKSNLPVDSFGSYGYSHEKCMYAVKLIKLDRKLVGTPKPC